MFLRVLLKTDGNNKNTNWESTKTGWIYWMNNWRKYKKEEKMSNHFFLLIFSLRIKALAIIPKGIANCEPRIIGEIIEE